MGANETSNEDVFFDKSNDELCGCFDRLSQRNVDCASDVELQTRLKAIVAELRRRGDPWWTKEDEQAWQATSVRIE